MPVPYRSERARHSTRGELEGRHEGYSNLHESPINYFVMFPFLRHWLDWSVRRDRGHVYQRELLVAVARLKRRDCAVVGPGDIAAKPCSLEPNQDLDSTALNDGSSSAILFAIRINILWLLSLTLSLICALATTLMQWWTRRYLQLAQS